MSCDSTLNEYSPEYSNADLIQATQGFDPRLRLGNGSFGRVFRAALRDGTEVAVKVIEAPEQSGFEEEVMVLSRFRHPNLVILMGFARQENRRFLVYEFLEGGDVRRRLDAVTSKGYGGVDVGFKPFPYAGRLGVALDAACGLSHLQSSTPKVFHRDIKSANILMDRNGTAKMADFGLACLSHTPERKVETAAGTTGYACPHYARRAVVTEGSEVYSFGIVLLELLTALLPATLVHLPDGSQRYDFVVSRLRSDDDVGGAVAMADQEAGWPDDVALQLANISLSCIQYAESMRPGFTELVCNLRQLRSGRSDPKYRERLVEGGASTRLKLHTGEPRIPAAHVPEDGGGTGEAPAPQHLSRTSGALCPQKPNRLFLWTLVCVSAPGARLIHSQEIGEGRSVETQRVGRLFQEDFFGGIARQDNESSSAISREHFQIWAERVESKESSAARCGGPIPCLIFLTNFSPHGTIVNGRQLCKLGEQVALHHGDSIVVPNRACAEEKQLTPLVEFCFDLTGSILCDDISFRESIDALPLQEPSNSPLDRCSLRESQCASTADSEDYCMIL